MEMQTKKQLSVELIQVDMPTTGEVPCSACSNVQGDLTLAIQEVQRLFDNLGCEIHFKQTIVKTIEEAEKAHISASPTIRVGHLEFSPRHLDDASEEREWIWNGAIVPKPSKEILMEVILKGYFEPENEGMKNELSPYIVRHLKREIEPLDCGCS